MYLNKSKIAILFVSLAASIPTVQAKTIKALFIGNSYTEYNNLPEMVHQMALTQGDTLIYAKSTPGGQKFMDHVNNANTIALINQGGWDFVILQEQSQMPSFPENQVIRSVYPFAAQLDTMIKEANPCAQTVFYMTWGRENGDAQNCANFPAVCTYIGMDSLLQLRYTNMSEQNKAVLAPVAKVWRYMRQNHPNVNLYAGDESHPSYEGSYVAAATFYSVLFKKDPTRTTYMQNNTASSAIKDAAKLIVFDSLNTWYQSTVLYQAKFNATTSQLQLTVNNTSQGYHTYEWDFGDGNTSNAVSPQHTYAAEGQYVVKLTAKDTLCNKQEIVTDTISMEESVGIGNINSKGISVFPNPTTNILNINLVESGNYTIKMLDVSGKLIYTEHLKSNKNKIDISQIPFGFYQAQIFDHKQLIYQTKVVKQ